MLLLHHHRIINIIRRWKSNEVYGFANNPETSKLLVSFIEALKREGAQASQWCVLCHARDVCSTAATNRFSLSRRAAQLAATHILELKPQQKQDQRLFPPPLLPRNVLTKVSFMDLNPLEVARQMTLIDHAHLRSISPSELYRFVHHSSSACSSIPPPVKLTVRVAFQLCMEQQVQGSQVASCARVRPSI